MRCRRNKELQETLEHSKFRGLAFFGSYGHTTHEEEISIPLLSGMKASSLKTETGLLFTDNYQFHQIKSNTALTLNTSSESVINTNIYLYNSSTQRFEIVLSNQEWTSSLSVMIENDREEESVIAIFNTVTPLPPDPQLETPTISLSGDTLTITEVADAEYYDIYVDGVLEESVPVVSAFNNVNITLYAYYSSIAKYQVNDGSWISVNKNSSTHNYTENNVEKLIIDGENLDTSEVSWYIKDANNTTIASGSGYDLPLDVTQYLSDGCSVALYTY